jgi:hypothetical protein
MKLIPTLILLGFMASFVSGMEVDDYGFETYRLESPYQASATSLRVLLPNNLEVGKRYRVLYVLPVH